MIVRETQNETLTYSLGLYYEQTGDSIKSVRYYKLAIGIGQCVKSTYSTVWYTMYGTLYHVLCTKHITYGS